MGSTHSASVSVRTGPATQKNSQNDQKPSVEGFFVAYPVQLSDYLLQSLHLLPYKNQAIERESQDKSADQSGRITRH